MRKQKKLKENQSSEEPVAQLKKVLDDLTGEDSIGIVNTIEETIQELESEIQLFDNVCGEETEYNFQPATDGPEQFTSAPSGDLVTTEQVNNALRREGSETPPSEPLEIESEAPRKGIRFRLTQRKEEKKKRREQEEEMIGIFGTRSKPSKWSLSHYLQSVASTREKRFVALTAWLLALIGLVISIAFVTKDFNEGRKEMASTVRYSNANQLSLPSVWLCKTDTRLPPFTNLPTQDYKGHPFLWLDFFKGSNWEYNLTYPETRELPQFEIISVNMLGRRCQTPQAMDPVVFRKENYILPECFHCIAISRNPPIFVMKEESITGKTSENTTAENSSAEDQSMDHVSLRLSINSVTSMCRRSQMGVAASMFQFFKSQMKEYHEDLTAQGILDFDGMDPANTSHDPLLWPLYRAGLRNATVDFAVFDILDMFCNVYLFSGFFYPSTSKGIKYKFNSVYYRWARTGEGPYYPEKYEDFYHALSLKTFLMTNSRTIGAEKYENTSIYTGRLLKVITNNSRIGRAEEIATLNPSLSASIGLSRNVFNEKEYFSARLFRAQLWAGDARSINLVYYVDLRFRSYVTRVVSDQLTVSWSAFIADFFGLISLFLDVSVYTLIVSPLIVRARQKAVMARKMHRAETPTV